MKKMLILAVAIPLLFFPLSASGMQILTRAEMPAIIAQAGVAIEFNDVVFRDFREDLEIWYQPGSPAVGFAAAGEPYQVLHINAVRAGDPDSDRPHGFYSEGTDLIGHYTDRFDYANAIDPVTGEAYFEPRPLTVSYEEDLPVTGRILDSQWAAERPGEARRSPVAGIAIGLPTLAVYTEPGSYDAFDVLITTAAVPGKPAPELVTADMIERMKPGSVVVDLAARTGGNCEPTQPGETIQHDGVTIFGPTNLPATVPHTASHLYANNVANFLDLLIDDGELVVDTSDEIVDATLLTHDGTIRNPHEDDDE